MLYVLLTVIPVALLVFALVDAIITDPDRVKHLPKIGWIVLIVFLPLVGSIAWILVGKDRKLPTFSSAPPVEEVHETDEERIEREIAFHENEFRIRQLEEELKRKRPDSGDPVTDSTA